MIGSAVVCVDKVRFAVTDADESLVEGNNNNDLNLRSYI